MEFSKRNGRKLASLFIASCTACFATAGGSHADPVLEPGDTLSIGSDGHSHAAGPDGHAPIGVMGDHMHKAGEWMLSYRFMRMNMEGNRIGNNSVSPEDIVTTVPNRFFGNPNQPPTLRVVPTQMTMNMHMFGVMYAPSDVITLMAMANYIQKDMDHITFAGGAGTDRLGEFNTKTEGFGDTTIGGLIQLYDDHTHHVHFNLGLSLPTGSITERDDILTPTGGTPNVRLPYPMQLGSGTFDLLPGITYTGKRGDWSWGAQYMANIRLESENDEGYALGDKHMVTGWIGYRFAPWISASFRVEAMTQAAIDGIDPEIVAPVQTADPNNLGGDRVDLLWGVNLLAPTGPLKGHRLAFEFGLPVYQNLNGPQLETDWLFTVGWQKAF